MTASSIRVNHRLRHCDIIRHNIDRYETILRNMIHSAAIVNQDNEIDDNDDDDVLREIYIFVDDYNCSSSLYPQFATRSSAADIRLRNKVNDESYSIEIQSNSRKAILYATNVWGVVRALETFSQLVHVHSVEVKPNNNINNTNCNGLLKRVSVYVNVGRIQDRPRFRYRGVMIDTARHFLPVRLIINNLVSFCIYELDPYPIENACTSIS